MTTLLPTLHERSDVARILTDILAAGGACPGITLVAMLDLRTGAVLEVRHLETPEALPDDVCDVPSELSMSMSPTLRSLAEDLAPQRGWSDSGGWQIPELEFITVVCREGEPATNPTEEQFFWGWRFSNHLTAAFHGDVYVATPTGWAGLLGGAGATPALSPANTAPDVELLRFPELAERHRLLTDPSVRAAAAVLAESALAGMPPDPGECLVCYEVRLMRVLGCDRTLRIARRFRDAAAPRAKALENRLQRIGAPCDCQVIERHGIHPAVVALERIEWEQHSEVDSLPAPGEGPGCFGVRRGSTQPCFTWVRLRRPGTAQPPSTSAKS